MPTSASEASSARHALEARAAILTFRRFQILLLLLTGSAVLFFCLQAVRFLPVTGENMYPESAGVLAAEHWASGLPLYADYRQPPYLITSFPPLWYAVLATAAKLGLTSLNSLTLFGRVLSLICLIALAWLAYFWNRRSGMSSQSAILAPAFYLSFPLLIPWAITARPDFMPLLFSFVAVCLLAFGSGTSSVALAGFAAALAFLGRHNAVAAPMTVVLWLLASRRWRHAAVFCTVWGILVGGTLLWFYSLSHGLLMLNLSGAKFGTFAVTYIHDVLQRLVASEGNGFALAVFAFGTLGFIESALSRDHRSRLLTIYLAVSLAFAILGSASAGGAVNHFLEPAFILAVLIPVGLRRLQQTWDPGSSLSILAFVMTLAITLPSLDIQRWNAMHAKNEDLRNLVPALQHGEVFTDVPFLAARTARPQLVDLASLINTERVGGWAAWSSKGIGDALRERRFELLVLTRPVETAYIPNGRYPRAPRLDSYMQQLIMRNYRLCSELRTESEYGSLFLYGPAQSNASLGNCSFAEALSRGMQGTSLH